MAKTAKRSTTKRSTAKRSTTKRPTAKRTPAKRPAKKVAATKLLPWKATGMSVHIGLNAVDPRQYEGWSGPLSACEFDANDMAAIARAKGMQPKLFLTRDAKRDAVLGAIRDASKRLRKGDFFFLTYSGHGGQIDDVTGKDDEDDKLDETWCLYDGQLIDDELYLELSRFAAGVRILVLSDSCHSGTAVRAMRQPTAQTTTVDGRTWRSKLMPIEVGEKTYKAHKQFYDDIQEKVAKEAGKSRAADPDTMLGRVSVSPRLTAIVSEFRPAVVLISGCQDNQESMDGDHNGAFTEQLLKIWSKGGYRGSYARFYAAIKQGMPRTQSPNLFTLGDSTAMLREQPFTV